MYRDGIDKLRVGNPAAREVLRQATRLGPMEPSLYLPLARACRERGLEQRAADFYRKFLAARPSDPEAAQAALELEALDADLDVLEPPAWPRWPLALLAIAITAALAAWIVAARLRRRERTLGRLTADNPELQPAIAHLCACLRHELFKHRVLAVGDAVRALADGKAASGQREFLLARLYGGAPLPLAWAGHLASFIRALGPRFDLSRNDPEWSAAGRALGELAGLEVALLRGDADAPVRLFAAWSILENFDRRVGALLGRLTHTVVDAALLDEVAATVRAEQPGPVEITVGEVAPTLRVEVYRVDLLLVLKNLLRNAARAAAGGPAPARVQLDVRLDLEPTGEEVVRVRVRDTSPDPLPAGILRRDRGLGIVQDALQRYDGCLEVAPGDGEWKKSVCVRLFRALDADELAA
jgi:signal transduction histidine kinase